jgi:intein/homing endonuclease/DNA-directed RNA polymerase subunit RPC12/RpoP
MVGEASFLSTGFSTYTLEVMSRLHATGKYELGELGCYCSPDDQRITSVPWKFYPNGPAPGNEAEHREYNSSVSNAFGEWKFEGVCSHFKPDIVCVPPGELVMTDEGYKPIEEIKVGTKVLTHTGKWQKVLSTSRRQYIGELVKIYFNGCKERLSLTPNHPVLVYKKRRQTNQKKSVSKIYKDVKPEFIPAGELKVGDYIVVVPPRENNRTTTSIHIQDHLSQFVSENNMLYTNCQEDNHSIPIKIELNEDLGELVGFIIGDGCIQPKTVGITFHIKETKFIEKAVDLFKQIFGLNATVRQEGIKNAITVSVHSILLSKFLASWIGPSVKKHIPAEFWQSSENARRGLLRGLVKSDGHYKKNTVGIATVSKRLAHEYRMLCTSLGIATNLCKDKFKYEINGYGESSTAIHDISQKYEEVNGTVSISIRRPRSTSFVNDHLISSIKRIRKTQYKGQVYNLKVENDESYIVQQSCVHNCDIRDYWMMSFEEHSPFRPYYHWVIMPTVDSEPQEEEWMCVYGNADGVFTYSDYGYNLLLKQGNQGLKLQGVAPPGGDFKELVVKPNKAQQKNNLGLPADAIILGTVMRNQKRKLYSDLMYAYRALLNSASDELAKRIYLYIHTGYPDVGWNIPKLLKELGIGHKVYFTYMCRNCGTIFPALYQDARGVCKACMSTVSVLPGAHSGINRQALCEIYNVFDLYVQYAICEGFGMPQVEAAACGVPCMAVDYSAMSDVVRKLKGYPIKVERMFRELETHCYRALPDNNDFVEQVKRFISMPESLRQRKGMEARRAAEENYSWDKTAKIWENYFDGVNIKDRSTTWGSPPKLHKSNLNIPTNLSDEDFIRWAVVNVVGRPELLNSYVTLRLIRDLHWGARQAGGSIYFNENSVLGNQVRWEPFNREMALQELLNINGFSNHWEQQRVL